MVLRHMVKNHTDKDEACCSHFTGYSFWLAARDLLHTLSHRQDSTHHDICYTSCGALAGKRSSSIWRIDLTTHSTITRPEVSDAKMVAMVPIPKKNKKIK